MAVKSGVALLSAVDIHDDAVDKEDVLVVDTLTGKLKWRLEQRDDYIGDGDIYKGMALFQMPDGLEAGDLQTGKDRWKIEAPDRIYQVTFIGDTLYLSVEEEGVAAIDPATGKKKWNFRPCFDIQTKPFVNEKYIILPCKTSRVFVGDAQTGKMLWQKNY